MIDERKRQLIELLIEGKETKVDCAKIVGISRTTIYDWMNEPEFKAELNNRLQQIKDSAEKEFNAKLPQAIDELWKLIQTTQDSRTKEKALEYFIDRSLGKTTARVDLTAKTQEIGIDDDLLEKEFEEVDEYGEI